MAVVAEAVEPEPSATESASVELAPLPSETALAAVEDASGPMATESVPVALESANVELALKYFCLAPPVARASMAEPTVV